MCRREDANWGNTPEKAKLNADMTCMYTNACPQVAALNRSNKNGLWGKLEIMILERGVNRENDKASRISVFNGPVFREEDRVYKGVQIPMEFWKLVLWYGEDGELKATAFRLSQAKLVKKIRFEEELDFNTNVEFLPYQLSIDELEKLTRLDFSAIAKYDTYDELNDNESLRITSEEEFSKFVEEKSVLGMGPRIDSSMN